MNTPLRSLVSILLLLFIFVLLPGLAMAQDPGCDPLCNCRADGSICPIDGGLGWLIAAGVGYGYHRVKKNRNKEESPVTSKN